MSAPSVKLEICFCRECQFGRVEQCIYKRADREARQRMQKRANRGRVYRTWARKQMFNGGAQ